MRRATKAACRCAHGVCTPLRHVNVGLVRLRIAIVGVLLHRNWTKMQNRVMTLQRTCDTCWD